MLILIMVLLHPVKLSLRLGAVSLLSETLHVEVCSFGAVVLWRMSYFIVENIVIVVTILLSEGTVQVGIGSRVCFVIEQAVRVGIRGALIVESRHIFTIARSRHRHTCGEKRLCEEETKKRRRRRGTEKRDVERGERMLVREKAMRKKEGTKGGTSPLYFRSESITMNCFWYPQESGGHQVGSEERRRSDE